MRFEAAGDLGRLPVEGRVPCGEPAHLGHVPDAAGVGESEEHVALLARDDAELCRLRRDLAARGDRIVEAYEQAILQPLLAVEAPPEAMCEDFTEREQQIGEPTGPDDLRRTAPVAISSCSRRA